MLRRVLLHCSDPDATPVDLGPRAVSDCWFDWHRQGGCGAGEVRLNHDFADRLIVEPGDWISIESDEGVRWYLGRVDRKVVHHPAGIVLRLEGMGVELGEVFPGGFGAAADDRDPLRFGQTDLFTHDPDRADETYSPAGDVTSIVRTLMTNWVEPQTRIRTTTELIEELDLEIPVDSLKLRGEESARTVIKELAMRAGGVSWGVNADGLFFFQKRPGETVCTLKVGESVAELEELSDLDRIVNRLLLTGDYVYDRADASGDIAVRNFRWRGNYVQPASRSRYGERRMRLWIPWIRTRRDARQFAKEFFRIYSRPVRRFQVVTGAIEEPPFPWAGRFRLEADDGSVLSLTHCDTIRVRFDHVPRLELEIGPEDPRNLWPEPDQDERWELPLERVDLGGQVSLTGLTDLGWDQNGGGGGGGGGQSDPSGGIGLSGPTDSASENSDESDQSDASDQSDDSGDEQTSGGTHSGSGPWLTDSEASEDETETDSDHSEASEDSDGSDSEGGGGWPDTDSYDTSSGWWSDADSSDRSDRSEDTSDNPDRSDRSDDSSGTGHGGGGWPDTDSYDTSSGWWSDPDTSDRSSGDQSSGDSDDSDDSDDEAGPPTYSYDTSSGWWD